MTSTTTVEQCRYHIASAERLFAGLNDSHVAFEPVPGVKTAGWLIGHLTVTGDFARRLCGSPPLSPREWRPVFNPGSQPSIVAADYPAMDVLRETFRCVYSDLCAVAANADQMLLLIPNPYEPARADFPTAGEFVEYLMTGHLAYHLGQLSQWRAAARVSRSAESEG